VKALLSSRRDLLPLARAGSWLVAYAFLVLGTSPKDEPGDQAQPVDLTTSDLMQITVNVSDHGR